MIKLACQRSRALAGATVMLLFAASCFAAGEDPAPAAANGAAQPSRASEEISELKKLLLDQQKQIEELRRMVIEQKKTAADSDASNSGSAPTANTAKTNGVGEVASLTPMLPPIPPAVKSSIIPLPPPQKTAEPQESPLSFRIGNTYITPVGFMDFTGVWRSVNAGSGIGSNFGSIPYNNSHPAADNSEVRLSPQNSRIGARFDSIFKGTKVLGYWESDFLGGALAGNVSVSSNSYLFRLRLFWIDLRKGPIEILGGQSWSLMTPGRRGISPLPGDLFYSQDIDVNYQAGLTWGRIPQFRIVAHPTDKFAAAISFENADQYQGGSGGGGTITLPSALATAYGTQLDNGTGNGTSTPNLHPDIIGKIAFDPSSKVHFEAGGVYRTFKTYNPVSNKHFTTAAGGGQVNLNVEVVKGLRLLTNNYWSDGGGRYLFGLAPDAIIRADGSISPVHSGSTVDGFEFTKKNTLVYAYYGGVLIGRNTALDGSKLVGYGYSGAPNSQNKSIQEATFGFNQTFWKDPKYGAINLMGQYSYLTRAPWYLAAGVPTTAHENIVFLNLRYSLPGATPKMQ